MLVFTVAGATMVFLCGWFAGRSHELKLFRASLEAEHNLIAARDQWRQKAIFYLRSQALGCVERQQKALAALEGRDA